MIVNPNNVLDHVRFLAVRTPLKPAALIAELLAAPEPLTALRERLQSDAALRQSIMAASPSLGDAMSAWLSGKDPHNKNAPLRLLAYAVRTCYRATPLGTCAGIGFVSPPGESTTLRLDALGRGTFTRPDMSLVADLAEVLDGERRAEIRYVANDAVIERGGRLFITSVKIPAAEQPGTQRAVTLRNTAAVAFVRELAAQPVAYADIVDSLARRFEANAPEAARVVDALIASGLLLSEFLFTPIGDPVAAFLAKPQAIAAGLAQRLTGALDAARALDEKPLHDRTDDDYRAVFETFSALSPKCATPVQIDMHVPTAGTLSRAVLKDVARMSNYLLGMAAVMELRTYRERFIARYEGHERMVPLLELVDENVGLGAPDSMEERKRDTMPRDEYVMRMAQHALRDRRSEVVLSSEDLEKLLYPSDPLSDPRSIELGFQIAAESAQSVDEGKYLIVPSGYGGTMRAGRSLGRFAHLFPEEQAQSLRSLARELEEPGSITAELVFPPDPARMYNVAIRPRLYETEIHVGLSDSTVKDRIPLTDLWVGLEKDRFFLWSHSRACRVVPVENHLLNAGRTATNVSRFLSCVAADGKKTMRGFDWGAATVLRMLPRVRCGRVVLCLQRWRLPLDELGKTAESARQTLERWRSEWRMPRYVHLRQSDNQLLLDLDSPVAAALLMDQLQEEAPDVEFIEALPSPSDVWLTGDDGAHIGEFVCALVVGQPAQSGNPPNAERAQPSRTRWAPGSQWLYAKLYLSAHSTDDMLVRGIEPFVLRAREQFGLDRWFFVRYKDEAGFHLRLRMHCSVEHAAALREAFFAELEQWMAQGRVLRCALDTYDPEYERYGGAENLDAAERLFTLDSDTCVALLKNVDASADARVAAAVASFLPWLGEEPRTLTSAIEAFAGIARQKMAGADRLALKSLIGTPAGAAEEAGLTALLERAGSHVLRSIFHMHCNRLEVQGEAETRAVVLLRSVLLAKTRMPQMALSG